MAWAPRLKAGGAGADTADEDGDRDLREGNSMRLLVLIGLALCAGAALAQPDWPTIQAHAEAFARERARDGQRLLLGPSAPATTPVPAGLSCAELYERRVALMQQQLDYRPAYTDDPRNQAAVFIGTIFTPAFYFLPFSGIQDYVQSDRKVRLEREIDTLRYAAAAQQCFVR